MKSGTITHVGYTATSPPSVNKKQTEAMNKKQRREERIKATSTLKLCCRQNGRREARARRAPRVSGSVPSTCARERVRAAAVGVRAAAGGEDRVGGAHAHALSGPSVHESN